MLTLIFYRSIGTQVAIYRKVTTTNIWGSPGETDWDQTRHEDLHSGRSRT